MPNKYLFLVYGAALGLVVQGCRPAELPHPSLTAHDVVMIQLAALQQNDEPESNHGIAIAWNFASPSNKENTGPIERFELMVQNDRFRPLINSRRFEIRTHYQQEAEAEFLVMIEDFNGEVYSFMVELSLQKYPPYEGCWMTDAVVPMPVLDRDRPKVAQLGRLNQSKICCI